MKTTTSPEPDGDRPQIEIDSTLSDVAVLNEQGVALRPRFYTLIDAKTRMILGVKIVLPDPKQAPPPKKIGGQDDPQGGGAAS